MNIKPENTGKTFQWRANGHGISGSKAFVELFEDVNGTITDKNIKTTFDAFYATSLTAQGLARSTLSASYGCTANCTCAPADRRGSA